MRTNRNGPEFDMVFTKRKDPVKMPRRKRERTPLEIIAESINIADLRMRMEYPSPEQAKDESIVELEIACSELRKVIKGLRK